MAKLSADLVARQGQDGGSQAGTGAEKKTFAAFKAFVQATDKKVPGPYLYDHAEDEATFYPDQLGGLTQAPMKERLTRLTAYTEALEAAADKTVHAQSPAARALLTAYQAATATKTKARTGLQQSIGELGPAAVAEALWDVHTAALYVRRRQPAQARRYFDYASLPNRVYPRAKAAAPKAA